MSGREIDDAATVAEEFNIYFLKKISDLRSHVRDEIKENPTERLRSSLKDKKLDFHLSTVSESHIKKIVTKLSNKRTLGRDGIGMDVVKAGGNTLIAPLTFIVNTSIRDCTFPNAWKHARVIPLLKKGSPKELSNYRPVSILPATSKILEEVVRKQVSNYVLRKKRLTTRKSTWLPTITLDDNGHLSTTKRTH